MSDSDEPGTVSTDTMDSEANSPASGDTSEGSVAAGGGETTAEPAPVKKTAGEALGELSQAIDQLGFRIDGIDEFVHLCKDKLFGEADEYRREALLPIVESMMRVHDVLFKRAQEVEAGDSSPDPFVLNLLETLESELRTHGIEVIRPEPGDKADVAVMKYIDHLPRPFFRKKDRIARVHSCGAALRQENDTHVLRKSTVTIYR